MKAETSSLKLVQLAKVLAIENHSWHHVIKCRVENEVKSHANTHTHTQSSTVVIIYAIISSERDTIRDNTKNQGYIIISLDVCM